MSARARGLLGLLLLGGLAAGWGCTAAATTGTVVMALDGSGYEATTAPGTAVLDETGLALLERTPVFFVVALSADDLRAPIVDVWPQRVPESYPDSITLDLAVPPGPDRRIRVTLLVAQPDFPVATWVSPAPGQDPVSVEVTAGQAVAAEVQLTELSRGILRATVQASSPAASVAWVDDQVGAVLPPASIEDGPVDVEVAIGRTYWPRVALRDGTVLSLPGERHAVEGAGETREVQIDAR